MIKKIIMILISLSCLIGMADAQHRIIVGAQSECDTALSGCNPIPLSASFLCDGTGANLDCPQYFAPDWADTTGLRFFGLTNRTNPPRCVKSTNGGGVWGLCDAGTVSPFTGALDGLGASMSVASDGSLIAVGNQGANNCIIRKSVDYGVSWSTVFTDTDASITCGLASGSPIPSMTHCASASSYCAVIATVGAFDLVAVYSTNNGDSWVRGTTFNIVSSDANIHFAIAADGNSGSLSRYNVTYSQATQTFASTSGADWSKDGVVPIPSGEAAGTGRCASGAMIFSGQSVLCGPAATLPTTYHFFTHGAGSTASAANVIPQNGLTNANLPDFMAVGFSGNTAYVIGRNATTSQIVLWVTRDTFSSMLQLSTLTPTTAMLSGMPRGDILSYNGKIYFSSGAAGANAFLGVIQ